jgi:hypothetical protein
MIYSRGRRGGRMERGKGGRKEGRKRRKGGGREEGGIHEELSRL